jgi:hypothetical protein
MTKEEKIQSAINNGTAQILTVDLAKELKGKKIITKYFGYRGQYGVDEFIIGDIKETRNGVQTLFTQDDRNTFIKAHDFNEGAFTCSDSDRFVHFIISE